MDRSVKAPGSSSGGELGEWGQLIAVGGGIGIIEAGGASMRIGEALYGAPDQDIPWNPIALSLGWVAGSLEWTGAATAGAVTLGAGSVAAAALSALAWRGTCHVCRKAFSKSGRAQLVDAQARWMARGKELAGLGYAAVAAKASDLQVRLREGDVPGVLIGLAVAGGQKLYGSYEDLHLDIWGPRQGKSTSRVIPAVVEAPGAVISTSNKRDVVDATRAIRAEKGRVWVFDPQQIAEEEPTWYWDPIAWVYGTDGDGAEERARELAGHFAAGSSDGHGSGDPFFEPEGEGLVARLLLACALDKQPITQAYEWVTRPGTTTPIDILEEHGFDRSAGALSEQYHAAVEQKSGVFATAKKMMACLEFRRIQPWVCPPAAGERPREAFDAAAFATSTDTLFPLSLEKAGAAGPLVTALCAAVAEAASEEGTRHGGRLPVPMLLCLDEAANIVKWRDLPKLYSHFGSRGIIVMTILQSWSQGVRCWGEDGMKALWSAANIRVLGSGVDDTAFLRDRSEAIGDHYEQVTSTSVSHSPGGGGKSRSTSTSRTTERTLTTSDLAALPRGRAVVFSAGVRPVLIETVPWMARPYAARIKADLAAQSQSRQGSVSARPALRIVKEGKKSA